MIKRRDQSLRIRSQSLPTINQSQSPRTIKVTRISQKRRRRRRNLMIRSQRNLSKMKKRNKREEKRANHAKTMENVDELLHFAKRMVTLMRESVPDAQNVCLALMESMKLVVVDVNVYFLW